MTHTNKQNHPSPSGRKTAQHLKEWLNGLSIKKLLTSLATIALVGWSLGCNSNPVQTPDSIRNQNLITGQQIQLLQLPARADVSLTKKYSEGRWIRANTGGEINMSERFRTNTRFKTASISASFTVPPNGLSKDTFIMMVFDDSNLLIEFSPHGLEFNIPAKLSYTVTGLDLSSVPVDAEIKLYYINDQTGLFEEMRSGSILHDRESGSISCIDGEIPHFSEYAFGYIKK